MAFCKHTHKDGISTYILCTLESWLGIFVKKTIQNLVQKISWCGIPCTVPDVSGCVLSQLSASIDIATTLCFMS